MPSSEDDESSSAAGSLQEQDIDDDNKNLENLPPKEKIPSFLNPLIDRIPAMQDFLACLVSMDGGCRPKEASIDNVRRVGMFLYQVQSDPTDVRLLWDDVAVNMIRNKFFENNNLSEKPRTATTMRAYIMALRLFYQFVLAKYQH